MSEEPEANLEDEWQAVLLSMSHAEFVEFMAWVWQGEEHEQ
jgi:hypothetical protein